MTVIYLILRPVSMKCMYLARKRVLSQLILFLYTNFMGYKLLTYKNGTLIIIVKISEQFGSVSMRLKYLQVAACPLTQGKRISKTHNITNKWAVWKLRLFLHITRRQTYFFPNKSVKHNITAKVFDRTQRIFNKSMCFSQI